MTPWLSGPGPPLALRPGRQQRNLRCFLRLMRHTPSPAYRTLQPLNRLPGQTKCDPGSESRRSLVTPWLSAPGSPLALRPGRPQRNLRGFLQLMRQAPSPAHRTLQPLNRLPGQTKCDPGSGSRRSLVTPWLSGPGSPLALRPGRPQRNLRGFLRLMRQAPSPAHRTLQPLNRLPGQTKCDPGSGSRRSLVTPWLSGPGSPLALRPGSRSVI